MKYTYVDGSVFDLKAQNDHDAILEAFDEMTRHFDTLSYYELSHAVTNNATFCYIDKWETEYTEEDDPDASTSITWCFEFQTDFHTSGGYYLKEIKAVLFDDTEITANSEEDFRVKISNHYQ